MTEANFTKQAVSAMLNYTNRTMLRQFVRFDASGEIRIPLYVLIFLLSIIGNGLVILTLVKNRRMRTVTNVFLLNLSVSDLLLAVFCMPFSLIPLLLRNFMFGEFMCRTIRYMQGVSVCVSCYTLLAISLERYFAICHPLRSRRWQTLSHSYKSIIGIWIAALIIMIPIAISNRIFSLKNGNEACREIWPDELISLQMVYSVTLPILLLFIPLLIMAVAYGRISYKLWFAMKKQIQKKSESTERFLHSNSDNDLTRRKTNISGSNAITLRQTNQQSINTNRKRVIKMLFVIVFEYFICWSPLYVLSTWKVLHYRSLQASVSEIAWSLVLLLSYTSSCIHPITYCFMNKNFRKAFVGVFRCLAKSPSHISQCTEVSNFNSSTSHSAKRNIIDTYSSRTN